MVAPNGQLGYGFPAASFYRGMAMNPDFVAVDAGSTDGGPSYLGGGGSLTDILAVKRDLDIIIPETLKQRIPLIIGSAGTAGGNPHLMRVLGVIQEILRSRSLHARIALIHSEIPHSLVREKIQKGEIFCLDPQGHIPTETDLDSTIRIVGQMGVDPIIKALHEKPISFSPAVRAILHSLPLFLFSKATIEL